MKKDKRYIVAIFALATLASTSLLWGCGSKEETDSAKPGTATNTNSNITTTTEKPQKFAAPPPPP